MADTEWERYKAEVIQLYLHEGEKGKPLKEVIAYFKENYGFCKTESQYRTQLNKWGIKKNQPGDIWKFVYRRVRKRALEGSDSDVYLRKKFVSEDKWKKEIARHVPLSYEYTCGSEPQTPEGVLVCTPGADVFSLGHEYEPVDEMPAGPAVVFSTASQALENLPCYQFQNQFLTWFSSEIQQARDSLMFPSDAIPHFGPDGTYPLNGSLAGFASSRTLDLIHSTPEKSIQDARQLLLGCLKENSNLDSTTDNANAIASLLEPVMAEQSEGDLARGAKKLFGSSKSETLVHFFQYCVYLLSNNMMPDLQARKFLRWLTDNGFRYLLKQMLQLNSTTVEIFASKLLVAAVGEDDVETVRILLEAGVDTDVPGSSYPRRTPLQEAVRFGNTHLVKVLLGAGANPNGLESGDSPLQDLEMCQAQALDIVQMLVNAGADPDPSIGPKTYTPLQSAINSNRPSIVKFLLKARADPNYFSSNTATPLQLASVGRTSELVEMLIRAGAKIDAISYQGSGKVDFNKDLDYCSDFCLSGIVLSETPLQIAAENENWEAVHLLLEEGAGVDLSLSTVSETALEWIIDYGGGEIPVFSPLQAAVRANNVTMVRLLLSFGVHIDARPPNDCGYTALQIAAFEQNSKLVRLLLQKGADINASAGPSYGRTALQAAATHSAETELLTFLLQAGADVDAPASEQGGNTALQAATLNGNVEAVRILLAAGADVNEYPSGFDGKTALQAAIICGDQALEIVKILLKAKSDVNVARSSCGSSVLQLAAQYKTPGVAEHLLAAGAVPNPPLRHLECTALSQAVCCGNISAATALLLKGADPNIPADFTVDFRETKYTPLQTAAWNGNIDLVVLLINWGADVNAPAHRSDGRTALQAAAHHGSLQVVTKLLEARADVNAPAASIRGRTALEAAVRGRYTTVVKLLLDRGAKLPIADSQWILHLAAKHWPIDENLVAMLIDAGADVNPITRPVLRWKIPVLYDIVNKGSFRLVQMCLNAGADVNIRLHHECKGPVTTVQAAVKRQHIDIVQALIDRGADVNAPAGEKDGATALQTAVSNRDIDIVQLLLKHGADANAPVGREKGVTVLQTAVSNGNIDIIKLLLKYGADIDVPGSSKNGRTALQMAAIRGNVRLVQLLLQHAADVNAPACHDGGVTALQGAAIAGNMRVLMMLLAAGADVDAAPARANGRLAIEGAAEHGRLDALHILLNHHPDTEGFELKKKRAANLAARNGHFAIARFIKAHKKGRPSTAT